MLQLKKLTITNFMNITRADLDLDSSGVVLHGPNGSGKSSVIEAIALCFTDRKRSSSIKEYIKHGASTASIRIEGLLMGSRVVSSLEITIKGSSTTTTRVFEHLGKTYNNSEVTEYLKGLNIEWLDPVMFGFQGDTTITELQPAARAKLLRIIFNSNFDEQTEVIARSMKSLTEEAADLSSKLEVYKSQTFDVLPTKEVMTPDERGLITARLEVAEAQSALLNKELEELTQEKSRIEAILTNKKSIDIKKAGLLNAVARLDQDITSTRQEIDRLTQKEQGRIDELSRSIQEQAELTNELERCDDGSIEGLESELGSAQEKSKQIEATRAITARHIEAFKNEICFSCGQPTSDKSKEEQIKQDLSNITAEWEQIGSRIKTLQEAITNKKKTRADSQKRWDSIGVKIQNLQRSYIDQIRSSEKLLESMEMNLNDRQNELEGLPNTTSIEVEPITLECSTKKAAVDSKHTERNTLSRQLSLDDQAHEFNRSIADINAETAKKAETNTGLINESVQRLNKIEYGLTQYKQAKSILENDLPNYIMVRACQQLEESLNRFIAGVRPNMRVRLTQSKRGVSFVFSPDIREGSWLQSAMSSGFEKSLLSVAWRVALAEAYDLDIIMLDEIDAAASSDASTELFRALESSSDFKQTIIITHREATVDLIKDGFDGVVVYGVDAGQFVMSRD